MDEARRIEQDVQRRRRVKVPKKIFLVVKEKLGEEGRGNFQKQTTANQKIALGGANTLLNS